MSGVRSGARDGVMEMGALETSEYGWLIVFSNFEIDSNIDNNIWRRDLLMSPWSKMSINIFIWTSVTMFFNQFIQVL